MADYLPQNSGLWSTTTWITAFSNLTAFAGSNVPPTIIDDVYADGKTITIDIDTAVNTIRTIVAPRTGGFAGGGFRINNAVSLTANIWPGSTNCLTFLSATPNFCTITGFATGSNTLQSFHGIVNSSSGIMNIIGGIYGGQVTNLAGNGLVNSGTVNLTGFVIGGLATNVAGVVNNNTMTVYGYSKAGRGAGNAYGITNNGTLTIYGSAIGGDVNGGNQQNWGVFHNSSSTVTVSGLVTGGLGGGAVGIYNNGVGSIIVYGDVRGTAQNNAHGIVNVSTGSISVTGNVLAGAGSPAYGINNNSTGFVTIQGYILGGSGSNSHGILNNSVGVVNVQGNIIGGTGSGAYGVVNNATGYMYVQGTAIGNGWGLGSSGIGGAAPGIFGSQTGTTIIRGLSCGPRGQWPTAGNVFIIPQSTSTATFETSAFQDVTLFTSLSTNIVPPASSVRLGTVYNLNQSTGTCGVPSISSVLQEVGVDNSVGIAALQPQTIWNYSTLSATDANSLGGRLVNVATVQSIGQQLTALN